MEKNQTTELKLFGISCLKCKETKKENSEFNIVSTACGGSVCLECLQSFGSTQHCAICIEQVNIVRQKTLVLQNYLENFEPDPSLILAGNIGIPFYGDLNQLKIYENVIMGEKEIEKGSALSKLFDCAICFDLLFDPVTVPCGHTFCRQCLSRAIDHNPCCPVCRASLSQHSTQLSRPTDLLIQFLTQNICPQPYLARAEREKEIVLELEKELPIFVCSWTFPKLPVHLHVFEPRYRLMMRRAMEGQRLFGMTAHTGHGPCEYGTLLRIEKLQMLPDGRSLIQAVGVRKFKINQTGVTDGYMTADVTYIDDEEFDPLSQPVVEVMQDTLTKVTALLESLPVLVRYQLVTQLGPIPSDPSILSYWVASLTQLPVVLMLSLYQSQKPYDRLLLVNRLLARLTGS